MWWDLLQFNELHLQHCYLLVFQVKLTLSNSPKEKLSRTPQLQCMVIN